MNSSRRPPPERNSAWQASNVGLLGGVALGRTPAPTLAKLRALEIQIWLDAHPDQNKTFDKQRRLHGDGRANPFVDPAGWQQFLQRLGGRFPGR